jgi:hypothetical protein
VPGANPHEKIELRIVPDEKTGIADIRFWYKGKLVSIQKIKNTDLKKVCF